MSIKFYTLASQQIKRPLTKYNVISLDIPVVRLNLNTKTRDYHIMFDDQKKLEVLKDYCKHEYLVTSININDIDYKKQVKICYNGVKLKNYDEIILIIYRNPFCC